MHNKNNNKTVSFIQGLRPFSSSIPKNLKKHLKKGGYNYSNIVDNWTKMVTKKISDACYPISVKMNKEMKEGTLVLNVIHGKELEIEYEKINYDQDLNNIFSENIENKILSSGEEYELILIGPASKIKNLEEKIDIKIIGRVSDNKEPILEFYKNKKIINLSTEGFDHFG